MIRGQFGTQEEFVARARAAHGDFYDYTKSVYEYAKQKLTITCPIHGDFEQIPNDHWAGCGCRKCATDKIRRWSQSDLEFVRQHYTEFGCAYCANALGKARLSVYQAAKRLGVMRRPHKDTPYRDMPLGRWKSLLRRAEKRGFEVNITQEYVWQIYEDQNRLCALTGWPIVFDRTGETTASVDRIDSSMGYIKGNIQIVHKDVNWCKNHFTEDRFYAICHAVTHYRAKDFTRVDIDMVWDHWHDTEFPVKRYSLGRPDPESSHTESDLFPVDTPPPSLPHT